LSAPLLDVRDLAVSYGAIRALRGVSFQIFSGEAVAIVGANGAGKSTLMRALSGLVQPSKGSITFNGAALGGVPAHRRAQAGMLHIREGRGVFGRMSVQENLRLAWETLPRGQRHAEALEAVYARFPKLEQRKRQLAGNLSGGEQQMLALSRAIVAPPRLLLVDEPSLGLSPLLTQEMFFALHELRAKNVTVLLVEQNVRGALGFADRGFVLNHGVFAISGSAKALLNDAAVTSTYLGGGKYRNPEQQDHNETQEEKTA
jgi:branched-chain amino acid transport system ATP-binding protein